MTRIAQALSAFAILAASFARAEGDPSSFGVSSIEVAIAADAVIDWNPPDEPNFAVERDFIILMFQNGVREGAERVLTGDAPAELRIAVTRFDILSTLELFFCCGMNEVDAVFELSDPATGDVIIPPSPLSFDHIGRGGVFGALADAEGEDQITRLIGLIADGTEAWLTAPR